MGRRRSNDGIKAIAGLVFLVLLVFGGIVVTFIKLITSILAVILAIALLALAGYGCYRLGRYWWNRKLDLEAHMPVINWSLPNSQQVDSTWSDILYPKFPDKTIRTPVLLRLACVAAKTARRRDFVGSLWPRAGPRRVNRSPQPRWLAHNSTAANSAGLSARRPRGAGGP